jgi:hypothetical protein
MASALAAEGVAPAGESRAGVLPETTSPITVRTTKAIPLSGSQCAYTHFNA